MKMKKDIRSELAQILKSIDRIHEGLHDIRDFAEDKNFVREEADRLLSIIEKQD